ncbi:hypothetical protein L3081_09145 [Colwellia sp. MSW7]|uniref:GH26 domain-containing protein n=1 Tax=Colwellia maritima TaxID=2912588 RepID=A0ABS9X241_9GAMM|nr:glycosyl hydrolase [Colwellia maritima]MCI2283526.1 hypothetical protein [Colwellia maritima]
MKKNTLVVIFLASIIAACGSSTNSTITESSQDGGISNTTNVNTKYMPRTYFGAQPEPRSQIIHGAGQDTDSFAEYSSLFPENNQPLIYMSYVGITKDKANIDRWYNQALKGSTVNVNFKTVQQIGISFNGGNDKGIGMATRVAAGEFDENIDHFLDRLNELNVPAYLRIGYEFEGSWNGYNVDGFVATFKRITDKVRARKMQDVVTVWCAAGGSAGFISFEELMKYYPGDDYVDWWAVDIFSPQEITNPWLGQFYKKAAEHGKPVMIGETTPRYVGVEEGQKGGILGLAHSSTWLLKTQKLKPLVISIGIGFITQTDLVSNGMIGKMHDYS